MEFDLGFLGGGQLARMSMQAAQRMGLSCISLDPAENSPASQVCPSVVGHLSDPEAISTLIRKSRAVTLENEFVPAQTVEQGFALAGRSPEIMLPGLETLGIVQDKLRQRLAYQAAGVPSPKAVAIENNGELALQEIGFPMVIKARFGGYDGKGTKVVRDAHEFEDSRNLWGAGNWLAEEFVPFRRELAVMVVRTKEQELELETVETHQTNYVCDVTYPARLWSQDVRTGSVPIEAVRAVKGYGIFGVELFEREDGVVLVNEIAPRPHNTGHYTLDWGDLSQFELHVRAVLGLSLPSPSDSKLHGRAVYMANLMGVEGANDYRRGMVAALELEPSARIHWYGKAESRPGRKMGHINLVARHEEQPHELLPLLNRVRRAFYEGWVEA